MFRIAVLSLLLSLHAVSSATLATAQAAETKRILVLAAASVSTAITEISTDYQNQTGTDVRVSIGSSGTLARQIMRGAPADIYVSAAEDWITTLTAVGHIEPEYTKTLARNRLVFISPLRDETGENRHRLLDISKPLGVLQHLEGGRLAIGDPSHVPAGRYAQEALENLGLWAAVRDRLTRQVNVRAVLAMVERGETPLGIVYATDAALSQKVRLAAIIPPESHTPIVYSAALISGSSAPHSKDFFKYLSSERAISILEENGFAVTPHGPKALPDQTATTFSDKL